MPDDDRFLAAAQSVADSIAALARPAVGGARWETHSYTGQPQYSTAIFGGTAGVVFLFADLFRVTGDPKAREVAEAAAMWVEAQSKADLRNSNADAGLYFGMSGHGQMCLHLYEATRRERWLRDAQARARAVARANWPDAHILSGSAGSLIFLLSPLPGDCRAGCAGCGSAGRRPHPANSHARRPGCALGLAARGTDPLQRRLRPRRQRHRLCVGGTLARYRRQRAQGVRVRRPGMDRSCGAGKRARHPLEPLAGRSAPSARAVVPRRAGHRAVCGPARPKIFNDDGLRQLAERCARATLAAGDIRNNPSQCHGLAGNAELFIELARVDGDASWLAHAHAFGDQALAYGEKHDGAVRWLGDEPGNYSPDFMLGLIRTRPFLPATVSTRGGSDAADGSPALRNRALA